MAGADPGPELDTLPDSYFWRDSLLQLLSPSELYLGLGLEPCRCVVLSGPAGSGRHSTAAALTESAADASEYARGDILALTLRAEDFPENLTPKAAAEKAQALFDLMADDEGSYGIFTFDQIGQYGSRHAVLNTIGDNLETENCFVILITDGEEALPADLLQKAFPLRLDLPDETQRETYLKGVLKAQVPDWDYPGTEQKKDIMFSLSGLTPEDLVAETAGFSYGDLANFSRLLRLEMVKQAPEVGSTIFVALNDGQVMNCLRLCRPRVTAAGAAPVVQVLQAGGILSAPQAESPRKTALHKKENRTFAENLELIRNTT
ncbi:MAG: hypothetical protein E7464_00600 [Ruminococcaceae bacterium]|nr:hypothetical protein [Oscillospiraceae bacterium]